MKIQRLAAFGTPWGEFSAISLYCPYVVDLQMVVVVQLVARCWKWQKSSCFLVRNRLFWCLILTISCSHFDYFMSQLWLFCITKHCFLDAEVPKIVPEKRFPGIIDMISWHFKMCKKVSSASRDATFIACHQTVVEEETEQLRDNRTTHAVG